MARRSELAVDARRRQLAQQVLVEVSLGVALRDGERFNHVHGGDEQARLLNHELRVGHVLAERRAAVEAAEVREHLVAHDLEHLLGLDVPELRPAQVLLLGAEDGLERLLRSLGAFFVPRLSDVEQAREHEEGDLLDDRERIGDSAGPELRPELVDVVLQLAGDHALLLSGGG